MAKTRDKTVRKDSSEKISACIVIKDEEPLIRGLLENVNDAVDEIVVVHDGPCSDRSLDICREYTSNVYVKPWTGQAEVQRPFGFSKCAGDWILWIDADEKLTPEVKKLLPSLVKRKEVSCYCFLQPLFVGKRQITRGYWGRQYRDTVLFRKSTMLPYSGLPNETLRFLRGSVVRIPLFIEHHPRGEKYTWPSFKKEAVRAANAYAKLFYERKMNTLPRPLYMGKAAVWFCGHMGYFLVWKKSLLYGWDNIQASFFSSLYAGLVWWKVATYRVVHK